MTKAKELYELLCARTLEQAEQNATSLEEIEKYAKLLNSILASGERLARIDIHKPFPEYQGETG
jgi:hypothetical protein